MPTTLDYREFSSELRANYGSYGSYNSYSKKTSTIPRRRSSLYLSQNASSVSVSSPATKLAPALTVCTNCRRNCYGYATFDHNDGETTHQAQKRRTSSSSSTGSANNLLLLGSYEESLLSGKLLIQNSSRPSVEFRAKITAIKDGSNCNEVNYLKLNRPFDAKFFDDHDDEIITPYIGGIEIQRQKRIPRKGSLQIVLFNPQKTAVQVILVPYDLRDMPSNRKTVVRYQKKLCNKLIQAAQFQVVCHENSTKVYIVGQLRLVFQNREFFTTFDTATIDTDTRHGGYSILKSAKKCDNCGAAVD